MRVSVIVPTYNERKNIEILIPELENVLNKIKHEVIIVDDFSPDGTDEAVKALKRKYRNIVLIQKKKEGIGAALKIGYDAASYDVIVSMDSDLSFEPRDVIKLLEKIRQGYDLVLGSRHMKEGEYQKKHLSTHIKAFISRFGNKLNTIITGVSIHDFSANFRAIKKDVFNSIKVKEKTNAFLMEMIVKTKYSGYKIAEIPVIFKDRRYGKSKLNLYKEAPKFLIKTILISLRERFFK